MTTPLGSEKQIIGKGGKPRIIRRQHCLYCNTVLALEITDKLGFRSHSEYWYVTKEGLWIQGRWYGNWITCPNCGKEGTLPGDKPLTAESILNKTPEQVEYAERVNARIERIKTEKEDTKEKDATESNCAEES